MRIAPLDKIELPCPPPFYDPFLAQDRVGHRFVELSIDKAMDAVALRETIDRVGPVLPRPPSNVVRNTDIQRSVTLVRKDVDARTLAAVRHVGRPLDPRFRGGDEIIVF